MSDKTVTELIAEWRSSPDSNDDAALASRINYAIFMGWLPFTKPQAEAPASQRLSEEQVSKLMLLVVTRCSVVATAEQQLGASDVGFEVQQVKYEIPALLNAALEGEANGNNQV